MSRKKRFLIAQAPNVSTFGFAVRNAAIAPFTAGDETVGLGFVKGVRLLPIGSTGLDAIGKSSSASTDTHTDSN